MLSGRQQATRAACQYRLSRELLSRLFASVLQRWPRFVQVAPRRVPTIPWTLFCSLRIAGSGVGGSPASAVSVRGATPLNAAVRLVGMAEPSREELSVRARIYYDTRRLIQIHLASELMCARVYFIKCIARRK